MLKITYRVPPGAASDLKLADAIAQCPEVQARGFSKAFIRKLLVAGWVYVNQKRVRFPTRQMKSGETIDLYVDEDLVPSSSRASQPLPLKILHEDQSIICFDKPAGLPSQPTVDGSRANVFDLAKKQLASGSQKPVYLGMHHRLDRDTSGVILFTRDERCNAWIADQFKEHKCVKSYIALVHGSLKNPKGRLESFLGPVGRQGKQAKFGTVRSGGKKAITDFLVLSSHGKYSLVEVRIQTGRTHQIRVHFSEMGHPIVGDTLYGSPVAEYNKRGRFLLHAHALTIEHPVTHHSIRVESPLPQEFRWPN